MFDRLQILVMLVKFVEKASNIGFGEGYEMIWNVIKWYLGIKEGWASFNF